MSSMPLDIFFIRRRNENYWLLRREKGTQSYSAVDECLIQGGEEGMNSRTEIKFLMKKKVKSREVESLLNYTNRIL